MPRTKTTGQDPPKRAVRRRIFFCRIDAGFGNNGKPKEIEIQKALAHIHGLPFTPDGRYVRNDSETGRDLCLWLDKADSPLRIRLANIRRGDFPPVEKDGVLSPLLLNEGGGLAEQTHFVVFPNGIVGCEYSHFGPRYSALGYYIHVKGENSCAPFRLNVLVRKDLEKQLASLRDVRLVQLKIRASFIDTISAADEDLGAAFKASARAISAENSDEIELVLKRQKRKGRPFWNNLAGVVRTLAGNPELKYEVSKFKLRGLGESTNQLVDVLSEQISLEKQIVTISETSKVVDNDSAYRAIEEAYAELLPDITVASELTT